MIVVKNLTKKYADCLAVHNVSFHVPRGHVVGFLGPNGAGKSTTMKILAGYLPASAGEVKIGGRDVIAESRAARRLIGYLPEECPLYHEMRIDEYLRFRGRLKGLSGERLAEGMTEVKELCGLSNRGRNVIGRLSKGFRQRVGLADALIHNPELLILDEPTLGLDPLQVQDFRTILRSLPDQTTVVISSHNLPEVEVLCDRVLVFSQGKIIADGEPSKLEVKAAKDRRVIVDMRARSEDVFSELMRLPHVKHVSKLEVGMWTRFTVDTDGDVDLRGNISELVRQQNWVLRELYEEGPSLERTFMKLILEQNK